MADIAASSSGYVIPPGTPVLKMADLMKEAEGLPKETTDLGNGVVVAKQGGFFQMVGEAQMSLRAKATAYEAARVGGQAGAAMFATFRKTHPEEFGAAAVAQDQAMLSGKMAEPPPRPADPSSSAPLTQVRDGQEYVAAADTAVNVSGGNAVTVTGSAEDDFLAVLYGSTVYGLAGNDRISAGKRATLDGGDGDDVLSAYERSTLVGGDGDDVLSAYEDSTLVGGAGNDRLSAYGGAMLDGGDGDDVLDAYENSSLSGGSGNDRLSAYGGAVLDGGDGDDRVSAYDRARVTDLAGDNDIQAYSLAQVTTGAGNDRIQGGDNSVVDAGEGHNWVTSGQGSTIRAGAGDDMLGGGAHSTIASGGGDDYIVAGRGSTVTAGTGDDRLIVDGGATIHFDRGDGNDVVGGGEAGMAFTATDRLSSSVLSFGTGIVPADLTMTRQGNNLRIQVGADSVTLTDVERHGIPTMSFADGSVLDGAQVAEMVGPAEPYQPASQVLQRFFDANRAYAAQQQKIGTAV